MPATLLAALVCPWASTLAVPTLDLFLEINGDFFRFLRAHRGWGLVSAAVPLHWFYHFNSGLGFILGVIGFGWQRVRVRLRLSVTL